MDPRSCDDDPVFDATQKELLAGICKEHDLPFEMVTKLLEAEKQSIDITKRAAS
ncbi:DNA modification system-associated small protein [Thermogemmatispora tikiterensis]|uniref:DNA modification system-associated small protein n=1 Tax=Thermogemmatispora tikiterensis TaxID=1825093 RepID=UPI001677A4CF|nr:hypothetical protein [Thermogemmatispora tikiterensis]